MSRGDDDYPRTRKIWNGAAENQPALGPLNGQCGLAADNLLGAEVVLADGRCVTTGPDEEPEF